MNLLERIKNRRFAPGEGVFKPIPDQGIKRFMFLLKTHFWKLVSLNLLLILFCIPIITIPAAICGTNRVLVKLIIEGHCFLWTEVIQEFKANLVKGMPFGLLAAFTWFDAYYFLSVSAAMHPGRMDILTAAIGFLFLIFTILFFSYVFVLLPMIDLKNMQIAKNSLILMLTEWKTNIMVIISFVVTFLFILFGFPYTLFFLCFISISFMLYIISAAISEPLQRRIIEPYQKQQNKSE